MIQNDRIASIDIGRGLAMLLVIYGHALEIFFNIRSDGGFNHFAFENWRTIYSFHMPAFYFISGLTASNLDTKPFRRAALGFISLLLVADITQLLAAPIYSVLQSGPIHIGLILKTTFKPILLGDNYTLVLPWFLISLAIVQMLAWFYLRNKGFGKTVIWFFCAALYLAANKMGYECFQSHTWAAGLIFFLLGRAVVRKGLLHNLVNIRLLVASALIASLSMVLLVPFNHGCLINPAANCGSPQYAGEFAVKMLAGRLGFPPLFLTTAALGISGLLLFAKSLAGTPFAATLSWIGRNTLPLFLINGVVLAFLEPGLALRLPATIPAWLIVACSISLLAVQVALLVVLEAPLNAFWNFCRLSAKLVSDRLIPETA